jgi:hypothetical protein
LVKLKSSFRKCYVTTMTWLTVMKYLCHNEHRYVPFVGSTSWSFPYSRLIIGFATRLTRRVPLVELDLQAFLEHLNSPKSLMGFELLELLLHMYVLSIVVFPFVHFSFDHCALCSSIYDSDCPFGIFNLFLV